MSENSIYTEQVECPYCHEVIKAPNQSGVTFFCSSCGKKLIVYDKEKETSEYDASEEETTKTWFWNLLDSFDRFDKFMTFKRKCILFGSIILFMFLVVVITEPTSNDANNVNKSSLVDPTKKAMIRHYLKDMYLKDPDSYQSIDWNSSESGNKTYVRHKYRAKNSFGGYVVEEKIFVFDGSGGLINIVD